MTKFTFKRICNDAFPGEDFEFDEYGANGQSAVSDFVSITDTGAGSSPYKTSLSAYLVRIMHVERRSTHADEPLEEVITKAKDAAAEVALAHHELERLDRAQRALEQSSLVRCHGPLVLRAAPCSTSHLFPKRDHAAVVSYRSGLYQVLLSFGTDGRDMEYLDARKIIESRWPGEPVCGDADHAMTTLGGVATPGDAELLFKHMIGLYRSLGLCD